MVLEETEVPSRHGALEAPREDILSDPLGTDMLGNRVIGSFFVHTTRPCLGGGRRIDRSVPYHYC